MHNLPTIESIRAVLDQPLGKVLRVLIEDRLADTLHCGLQDLSHVLVVETGDIEQQKIEAIGFSPLKTRIENPSNCSDWDWCERRPGWWELLYTVGDHGFAYILLAEDAERSPLPQLCSSEEPSQ